MYNTYIVYLKPLSLFLSSGRVVGLLQCNKIAQRTGCNGSNSILSFSRKVVRFFKFSFFCEMFYVISHFFIRNREYVSSINIICVSVVALILRIGILDFQPATSLFQIPKNSQIFFCSFVLPSFDTSWGMFFKNRLYIEHEFVYAQIFFLFGRFRIFVNVLYKILKLQANNENLICIFVHIGRQSYILETFQCYLILKPKQLFYFIQNLKLLCNYFIN